LGKKPGRTAVARAGVEDVRFRAERTEPCGQRFDRPPRGRANLLVRSLVQADVDVLTAPDVEVEVVRVVAVVVLASRAHGRLVRGTHSASSSRNSFSATWTKKSGSLSRYVS